MVLTLKRAVVCDLKEGGGVVLTLKRAVVWY